MSRFSKNDPEFRAARKISLHLNRIESKLIFSSAFFLAITVYPLSLSKQSSIVAYPNVDDVSLSHRLGHSTADFTKRQYGHVMEEADQRNADILSDVILKGA